MTLAQPTLFEEATDDLDLDGWQIEKSNDWYLASTLDNRSSKKIGVDRGNAIVNGYVVAQLGAFKNEMRGEFNLASLHKIIALGNGGASEGLKVRFGHPNQSKDAVGTLVGRSRNFRLDADQRTVRADLHINPTALKPPPGAGGTPYGTYIMDLAETDPGAFATSLALKVDKRFRINEDGTRKRKENGDPLPPIWDPVLLHASDIVDDGDATSGYLSAGGSIDGLRDAHIYKALEMLDGLFGGKNQEFVRTRLEEFLQRYLTHAFPDDHLEEDDDMTDQQLAALQETLKSVNTGQAARDKVLTDAMATLATGLNKVNEDLKSDREERKKSDEAAAAATRQAKIHTLCQQTGITKASEIAAFVDSNLSAGDIATAMIAMQHERKKLPGEGGDSEGDLGNKDSVYLKEYKENQAGHESLGVTPEQYIVQRRLEAKEEAGTEVLETDPGREDFERIQKLHSKALLGDTVGAAA